jgi:hypothetical protein
MWCLVCLMGEKTVLFARTAAGPAITPASSYEEGPGELPRTCQPCSRHTNLRKTKDYKYWVEMETVRRLLQFFSHLLLLGFHLHMP